MLYQLSYGGGVGGVLAFPYDEAIVRAVRGIPGRRFDWESREWSAPVDDWAGAHVAEVLARFPQLSTTSEVDEWLASVESRWIASVSTTSHDGLGWWRVITRAGQLPEPLRKNAIQVKEATLTMCSLPEPSRSAGRSSTLGRSGASSMGGRG